MLVIKGVIGSLCQTAIIGALILLPGWTWQWTEANQFLICYGFLSVASTVFLALKAPTSLEARMEMPMNETQPLSDRIATRFLLLFLNYKIYTLALATPSLNQTGISAGCFQVANLFFFII